VERNNAGNEPDLKLNETVPINEALDFDVALDFVTFLFLDGDGKNVIRLIHYKYKEVTLCINMERKNGMKIMPKWLRKEKNQNKNLT
jgi:hypothetical protein